MKTFGTIVKIYEAKTKENGNISRTFRISTHGKESKFLNVNVNVKKEQQAANLNLKDKVFILGNELGAGLVYANHVQRVGAK